MEQVRVEELYALDKRFDIFTPRPEPDPTMLREGFYIPVPITGTSILWGFHVINAASRCGVHALFANLVPPGSTSALLAIALALEDRAGRYEWDELERVCEIAGGIDALDERLRGLLFGDNHKNGIERLRAYSALTEQGKELVNSGGLDVKTAFRMRGLHEGALAFLAANESFARLTRSEKRIFCEYAYEAIMRDTIEGEAQISFLGETLASGHPLAEMEKARFPRLAEKGKKLDELRKKNLSGSGITLEAPPQFEGDSFTISFSFSSRKSFCRRLESLRKIEDSIDELIGLL